MITWEIAVKGVSCQLKLKPKNKSKSYTYPKKARGKHSRGLTSFSLLCKDLGSLFLIFLCCQLSTFSLVNVH